MATAVLWADLDRQQTIQVSTAQPWIYDNVSRLLCDFLNFDATTPHGEILMKMYFQNLKFAVEKRFTTEKTSTLFSVLKLVHFTSMERSLSSEQSVKELHRLLIEHAVERPPYSVGIFSPNDIRSIMDHVTDTYYRHYKLYRYAFTKKRLLDFSIKPDTVEVAPGFKSLAEGKPEEDVREPDVEQVAPEEQAPLTQEEEAVVEEQADEELLADEKTDMVQKLVAKKLESVKEQVEKDFASQEEAYQARIAALEAKLAEK